MSALGLLDGPRTVPLAAMFVGLAAFPLAALYIERVAARLPAAMDGWVNAAHALNTTLALGLPIAVIHVTHRRARAPLGALYGHFSTGISRGLYGRLCAR